MASTWQTLTGNLATIALIVFVWKHILYRRHWLDQRTFSLSFGLALGVAAIASMMMSVEFQPGIYFDLRLALVISSAAFAGPVPALITSAMAGSFRLWMGGVGSVPGLAAIFLALILGTIMWLLAGRRPLESLRAILLASTLSAMMSLAVLTMLGTERFLLAVELTGAPIAFSNFAMTAAIGLLIAFFRRFTLERDTLFAALVQAPEYHYIKDLQHRFVATNANVARHHGKSSPAEMVGLTDLDLTTRSRAEELHRAEQHIFETGTAVHHHEECLNEPGKGLRWYSTSKVPLRNRRGELIGLAGVTVDITKQKLLEQDLEANKNTLSRALSEMSDGLAMFGADGRLIFCNEQYLALFPKSSYIRKPGTHITDILRALVRHGERIDLPSDLDETAIQAAADRLFVNKDEELPMSDGRWLSLRTRSASDGTVLALVSDITALKKSERSLASLAETMRDLAETDSLTGLANRRRLETEFQKNQEEAISANSEFSLILIDVDRFKLFNDTYGHTAGDSCLKKIAGVLQTYADRHQGLALRLGGEEFGILLGKMSESQAVAMGNALRGAVRALQIEHKASEYGIATVSLGIATSTTQERYENVSDMLTRADEALYEAKRCGRDSLRMATARQRQV